VEGGIAGDRLRYEVAAAFQVHGFIENPLDRMEHIFGLVSVVEAERSELLGEVLVSLCDIAGARVEALQLVEQFQLAWRFSNGEKLYGTDKITGRELAALLKSLTKDQRILISRWLELVMEDLLEAKWLEKDEQLKFEVLRKWLLFIGSTC
jgi:hypothetical protein